MSEDHWDELFWPFIGCVTWPLGALIVGFLFGAPIGVLFFIFFPALLMGILRIVEFFVGV